MALLIDQYDRSVLLFRSGTEMKILRGNDAIDLGDVLPGFVVTVADLFGSLRLAAKP